ncbi:MAG: hypothetical protein OEV08_08665 [Nitrospira sp.]|nr:hypothetical protein [Nitrospira sp.]
MTTPPNTEGTETIIALEIFPDSYRVANMKEPRPVTATLDINLLFDKALNRQEASEFDQIVALAQQGKLKLFFTLISDVEDRSGAAMEVAIRLLMDGTLSEDPLAGAPREFMPYGPGGCSKDDPPYHVLLRALWPKASFMSKSMTNKENAILSLQNHVRNGRDIFLTRDEEILKKRDILKRNFGIMVLPPKELLSSLK